ncbi:MAG: hypothetical protein ACKVPX_03985 [Myxococcaceae bacterium]
MKRSPWLGLGLIAVAAIVLLWMSQKRQEAATRATAHQSQMERFRRDHVEASGFMRGQADEKAYREDLAPFFREYFAGLEAVYKKGGVKPDPDAFLKELSSKRPAQGEVDRSVELRALYDKVRRTFDSFREGRYQPVLTKSSGAMRLDVVTAGPAKRGTDELLVFEFLLWGAPRELREDSRANTLRVVTSASMNALWKLRDKTGKLLYEVRADSPGMRVDYPERYVADFPAQMLLAEYQINRVPAEVEQMELTINVSARAPWGSSVTPSFTWTLDVPAAWKLQPGQKWEGLEVADRDPSEIAPPKSSGR